VNDDLQITNRKMSLLGIDLGTSGVKALLIDESGNALASATVEYPLSAPHPLWSEQNPADWWRGSCDAIRAVLSKAGMKGSDVRAIGLSGQMHGLTLLDKNGEVLRPAILWNDQRTSEQCESITNKIGGVSRVLEKTANVVLPGFTAPKILWVRENEPSVYDRISKWLLPKDFVRFKLTGEFATEVSDASGTSLFDVKHRRWSDAMMSTLDLSKDQLARCYESHEITGKVSSNAAQETGLVEGTPVVGGAGDQAASAVGAGIVREGVVSVTIGTSGVVFASMDRFAATPNGELHAFCHALPNTWHVMGVMLSAGGSLQWWRNVLRQVGDLGLANGSVSHILQSLNYDQLLSAANESSAGAEGLIFLPYLTGERTPHPDPLARGAFIGLTTRHTQAHLARAVVEGITYGLRDSLELARSLGITVNEIRVAGGGAKSAIWRQMLADIFECEITLINSTEGGAFSVALLSGVGVGVWKDAREACDATLRVTNCLSPSKNTFTREAYKKSYEVYRALYPILKSTFGRMRG
jgi:xylulokinase